ncbi:MAG: autotransporter domain-containing protein [Chlorobium sp.]|nr:MAG: autotransporter domain-containing protein [Chlorobium sp.]
MKLKRRIFSVFAFALAASANSFAHAETSYTSLITFGDSLTDGGSYSSNVIAGSGGLLPSGIHYRFTTNFLDGSARTWAEYLAASMGLQLEPNTIDGVFNLSGSAGTNYAQGGAQVTVDPGLSSAPGAPARSVEKQIDAFLAVNPQLHSSQLFVLWAGANDLFHANPSAHGVDIATAAVDLAGQIQRLKSAGATYIVVNGLPNLGQTPLYSNTFINNLLSSGDPALAAAASTLFNTTLKQSISGKNVIYVDTAKLLGAVVADPVRFGFNPVAGTVPYGLYVANNGSLIYPPGDTTCLTHVLTSLVDPREKAFANSFIFTDPIHPTDAAHALFGQAVFGVLRAVDQKATTLFETSYAIRQQGIDLEPRLSAAALLKGDGMNGELRHVGDNQFWFGGSLGGYQHNSTQLDPDYSANTEAGSVGVDRMITSDALLGAAFSYSMGHSTFGNDVETYDSRLSLATLYGTAFLARHLYVNASLQYGDLSLRNIQRTVALGATSITSSGSTAGTYKAARIGLGYENSYGSWSCNPSISLTAARTLIKGYTESDTPVSLAYGDAEYNSNIVTFAISCRMNGSKDRWLPAIRLGVDHDLDQSPMTVGIGPDNSLIATLPIDKPMRTFYNASVGVQRIMNAGTVSISLAGSAGSDFTDRSYMLSARYTIPF